MDLILDQIESKINHRKIKNIMKTTKYTSEMAIEMEIECLLEALFNGLIDYKLYCNDRLKTLLVPYSDDIIKLTLPDYLRGRASDYYGGCDINIPIGEIEIQFEGDANNYFDNPDDWTINGDLAYYYLPAIGFDVTDWESLLVGLKSWGE